MILEPEMGIGIEIRKRTISLLNCERKKYEERKVTNTIHGLSLEIQQQDRRKKKHGSNK